MAEEKLDEVELNTREKGSDSDLGSETDDSFDSPGVDEREALPQDVNNSLNIDPVGTAEGDSEIPQTSELRQRHIANLFDGD